RSVDVDHETLENLRGQVSVQKNRGRPGRFMPRWASRIDLELVSRRIERLHDITEEDARAEGVGPIAWDSARDLFADLWREINGAGSWDSNPWVWRLAFRRIEKESNHGR